MILPSPLTSILSVQSAIQQQHSTSTRLTTHLPFGLPKASPSASSFRIYSPGPIPCFDSHSLIRRQKSTARKKKYSTSTALFLSVSLLSFAARTPFKTALTRFGRHRSGNSNTFKVKENLLLQYRHHEFVPICPWGLL